MMSETDLKDFIASNFASFASEISRLSNAFDRQNMVINDIQVKMTTRVAEIQKDIDDLRKDISEIRTESKSVNDSQKFRWKTLSEERRKEKEDQAEKDLRQNTINQSIVIINRLLWTILGVVLTLGITFVWQMIVNGGLKGMVP